MDESRGTGSAPVDADADVGSNGRAGSTADAGFEASLRAGGERFDASDAALLRAVDEAGSLNAAADALGRSYSRAHERLTALEAAFGPLVERQRGGPGGGGSRLTDRGREVLAAFDRLRTAYSGIAEVEATVLPGTVVSRDGELGTVETPAGRVRALVPAGADDVDLRLRADAVTLHATGAAPPGGATSARNRFEGTVVAVDRGESVARVTVDVGTPDPLVALVTMASVEKLQLEPGRPVVASFKATATRGTAVDGPG